MKKSNPNENGTDQRPVPSIVNHFARVMEQARRDDLLARGLCPECGQDTLMPNGCSSCRICRNCGWSGCDL